MHAKHHYWTGWQDLDVTTETLVPRQLRGFERITINSCWRLWIPLFASLYRWNNYWNLTRLRQMFQRPRQKKLVTMNILAYLSLYIGLTIAVGLPTLLTAVGLGLLVSFALQDLTPPVECRCPRTTPHVAKNPWLSSAPTPDPRNTQLHPLVEVDTGSKISSR